MLAGCVERGVSVWEGLETMSRFLPSVHGDVDGNDTITMMALAAKYF